MKKHIVFLVKMILLVLVFLGILLITGRIFPAIREIENNIIKVVFVGCFSGYIGRCMYLYKNK